jgi:hypothetical protein
MHSLVAKKHQPNGTILVQCDSHEKTMKVVFLLDSCQLSNDVKCMNRTNLVFKKIHPLFCCSSKIKLTKFIF